MAFSIRKKDLRTLQDILSGMKFVRGAKVFAARQTSAVGQGFGVVEWQGVHLGNNLIFLKICLRF
jgi:hypothetical protein